MNEDFTGISIKALTEAEKKAAVLFAAEIEKRTQKEPPIAPEVSAPFLAFSVLENTNTLSRDGFSMEQNGNRVTVFAKTIRGFIFGYSLFLRKTVYQGETITLITEIDDTFLPQKKIRGHQLGYRPTPNTYDAWGPEEYRRYYLDIMAFGCNTVEHIPYEEPTPERNVLMKYDAEDLLEKADEIADELDLDVSLWYANCDKESEEAALRRREGLFRRLKRIDAVFVPGGDPGEMYADVFIDRCRKIAKILKEAHPEATFWPSAQAPHSFADWGDALEKELQKEPPELDGLITGPNHAFPIHELREKTPARYPLRFYPDITHNVRCEYPVHFLQNDWHFALAAPFSRESVNPRPTELRTLHKLTSPYTIGSVSYSEGVHDDVNKMVWSAMEFDPDCSLRETLKDYARLFFWDADADAIADAIFALELNWQGDPLENSCIDATFDRLNALRSKSPLLDGNWRFNLLWLRACCDKLIRRRRIFETELINEAKLCLHKNDPSAAEKKLNTPFDENYRLLRGEIERLASVLFDEIGLQLDVARYHAQSWERGALLETLDLPITNRTWLLGRIAYGNTLPEKDRPAFWARLLSRDHTAADEYYFSVALHGLDVLGAQQPGEYYMDFQGDRPHINNGTLPMESSKLFDHFSFHAKLGGFTPGKTYLLRIAYQENRDSSIRHHRVEAGGVTIWDGPRYGGAKDPDFDREMLAPGFESAVYTLPPEAFRNGALDLCITEPTAGFKLSELWITRKN